MAIRTINYTVSVGGITPTSQQFGGTQGDHNAVELKFTLDTELYNNVTANAEGTVYYRFDGYDGSGGVKSTEPAPLDDSVCTYGLEEWITRYGGKVQVYLVLTDITDTTEMELYSFPAVLNLKDRPDGHSVDGGDYESISTLYEGAKASADKAENAAVRAEQVLDDIGGAVPDIDITEVSDGVEITVTSKEGIETAKVYNGRDGADGKDVDYSLVANALKGTASGEVVAIKDVSPLPHNVTVRASGEAGGQETLTKTVDITEAMQTVLLDTPASSVRVVVSGGAYCVGGLVPTVSGDDLTVSGVREQLALWPTWSYGEAPGVYDLEYTISGDTLSWSGVKYYASDSSMNEVVSGSVELSTTGQKIIGFCQIYCLDEDNPYAEYPEWDELNMTVAVYESTPSVEVKVYGKNLLPDLKAFLNGGNIYFGVTAYTQGVPLKKGTYTFSFVSDIVATGVYVVSGDGKDKIAEDFTKKNRITFTLTEDMSVRIRAYSGSFTKDDAISISAQLEVGSSVTEYEPYTEPTNHTVMADGTDIKSVYPSMTFVPETDGVELSVEYNRDINKAFAELQAALISMGGNV